MTEQSELTAVECHNAYAWISPDADACELCGRKSFATPVDGFQVQECDNCQRLVCEIHADVDCGGEGEGCQWRCGPEGRAECQRLEEAMERAA